MKNGTRDQLWIATLYRFFPINWLNVDCFWWLWLTSQADRSSCAGCLGGSSQAGSASCGTDPTESSYYVEEWGQSLPSLVASLWRSSHHLLLTGCKHMENRSWSQITLLGAKMEGFYKTFKKPESLLKAHSQKRTIKNNKDNYISINTSGLYCLVYSKACAALCCLSL